MKTNFRGARDRWTTRFKKEPLCLAAAACVAKRAERQSKHRTKPIEDVGIGDLVWAWDNDTENAVPCRVVRLFKRTARHVLEVCYQVDSDDKTHVVIATAEHPFLVQGKGWVSASDLKEGHDLLSLPFRAGKARVISICDRGGAADVFNIEVQGLHNYFVGQHSVLVHNHSSNSSLLEANEIFASTKLAERIQTSAGGMDWVVQQSQYKRVARDFRGIDVRSGILGALRADGVPAGVVETVGRNISRLESPQTMASWIRELAIEVGTRQILGNPAMRLDAFEGYLNNEAWMRTLSGRAFDSPFRGARVLNERRLYTDPMDFLNEVTDMPTFDPFFQNRLHSVDPHVIQPLAENDLGIYLGTRRYEPFATSALSSLLTNRTLFLDIPIFPSREPLWLWMHDIAAGFDGKSPEFISSLVAELPWRDRHNRTIQPEWVRPFADWPRH